MVPVAILLARVHPLLVPVASVALWWAAGHWDWNLPTEPGEPRGWYFDPVAWQLMFFSGFSLSMKWVRPPPADRRLWWASVAVLGFGLVMAVPALFETLPGMAAVERWVLDHTDKTTLDWMQYVHFMASAYVAVRLLDGRLHLIQGPLARPLLKCGQQALSAFLVGIVLSDLGGLAFDELGTGLWQQLAVNAVAFAATFATAYAVAWFKAAPWAKVPAPPVAVAVPALPPERPRPAPARLAESP
jgi:hypothetical protein